MSTSPNQSKRVSARPTLVGVVLVIATLTATASFVRPLLASAPELLLEAAAAGDLQLARRILDQGVPPDARDRLGHTALMLAADRGHRDVAEAILDQGAAINAKTPAGNTALMMAASRGHLEVVRLFLERGADVTAVNADGWSAVTLAQEARYPAVVALLRGAMPSESSTEPSTPTRRPTSSVTAGAPLVLQSPPQMSGLQAQVGLLEAGAYNHRLSLVLDGLSSPLYVTNARDQSNRLFVVEQGGRILVLQPQASTASVFLDITARVVSGGERGLLGLAFHPNYAVKRRFFVNYTRRSDGATVIAEYQASLANSNVADAGERVLLVVAQPFANHNGGMIEFGPDGFLYIGMGDGGSANDPGNRAQNINDLLGKILRINVDAPNPPAPYSSPSDNPFFGSTAGRDEIFALGFRNPFRFSFDRETGDLIVGDVGQDQREEIDVVTLGGNYGWRVFEGTRCTGLDPLCGSPGFIPPIAEYAHNGRCSITGGYVYRGTRGTLPLGTYVYGDFCTGEILTLRPVMSGATETLLADTDLRISSFGEDEAGEIYVVGLGGTVHRIESEAQGGPEPGAGTGGGTGVGAAAEGGGGNGGACFIATAAFGSPLAPEVQALRNFRDRYLSSNAPGRALVAIYYRLSPPAADLVREHPALRDVTRFVLRSVIWGARLTDIASTSTLVLLVMVAGGSGLVCYGIARRRRRHRAAA
jgi:glucose/arabinose dehydrogenase